MINFITWDISPEIFNIGIVSVRWYSVLFALGLVILGPMIEDRIWKREGLSEDWYSSLFIYVVLGTVIGARLGHVLFYNPMYYLANPISIFKVWEGGLASHGGTIGVIFAVYLYSKRVTKKSILFTLDRLAVPVGLVAALIRLGNLMNSEIFGSITDKSWGFRFVNSGEYRNIVSWPINENGRWAELSMEQINKLPAMHPTQIYEAIAYLFVFAVCMYLYWKRDAATKYSGLIVGVFLTLVFSSRFIIEKIKIVQESWELSMIDSIGINMGQLLSVPFIIIGIILIVRAIKNPQIK